MTTIATIADTDPGLIIVLIVALIFVAAGIGALDEDEP